MKRTRLFREFFNSEKAGGLILVFATIVSLTLANSPFKSAYAGIWEMNISGHSLVHWINDGLMAIFFLMIGLELEREIYKGELANIKNAIFPIFAAIGGMIVPAGIYTFLNFGTEMQSGAGIPTATDIAFAIGILSLLGNKVPLSLKVFLTALAIIDDLGAILVIAVFYTSTIAFSNLFIALGIGAFLFILNRLKIYNLIPYLIGGIAMWYFMSHSGVHATITGVILAFLIPFGNGGKKSPSYVLQHLLHRPVSFLILPLFALANTSITIGSDWQTGLTENYSIGILLGLVLGKPIGIWLFSLLGVGLGFCALPGELKWKNILGAGFLGGIGFTMSIFITLLAFDQAEIVNNAKITILIASLVAGITGYLILKFSLNRGTVEEEEEEEIE
jgi:NhaA family Na+:H+ antiporter